MRDHLEAIKALLEATGREVHLGEVQGTPKYPYYVIWSTTGQLHSDAADGAQSTLRDIVGVTCSGRTFESVLEVSAAARAILLGARLAVDGYDVKPLMFHYANPVQLDRDAKIPNTNLHPAFGVDQYRLISEPVDES